MAEFGYIDETKEVRKSCLFVFVLEYFQLIEIKILRTDDKGFHKCVSQGFIVLISQGGKYR